MINLLMTSGLRLMCLFCICAAYTLIFQILYTDILIFNYQFYCYSTIFNSNQQLLRRRRITPLCRSELAGETSTITRASWFNAVFSGFSRASSLPHGTTLSPTPYPSPSSRKTRGTAQGWQAFHGHCGATRG